MRFFGRGDGLARASSRMSSTRFFAGDATATFLPKCCAASSPMVSFLNATGIRLIRISRRDRMVWDCKAYCARSFLARSVTVESSVKDKSK